MGSTQQWQKDSYHCAQTIDRGLSDNNHQHIEEGLSEACDLFVEYVLEDRHNDLTMLGQALNSVYFPHRSHPVDPSIRIISYLGQMRALINLCDYITQRIIPERIWHVVGWSKYAKSILQALLTEGAMRAQELSTRAGLPHKAQLARTVQPLVDEGLVKRHKFGKNVWYSLTATGRAMVSRYFRSDEAKDLGSIVSAVLTRLGTGWRTADDITEQVTIDINPITLKSLVGSTLSGLCSAGLVEERAGSWRLSARVAMPREPFERIASTADFAVAVNLICSEFEHVSTGAPADGSQILKAKVLLNKAEQEITGTDIEQSISAARISLERAMCCALEAHWQTAISLAREAATIMPGEYVDDISDEMQRVWSCIQMVCVRPLVAYAERSISDWYYEEASTALSNILNICQVAQLPLDYADLSTRIAGIAQAACAAAGGWKIDVDAKLNRVMADVALTAVSIEKIDAKLDEGVLPRRVVG